MSFKDDMDTVHIDDKWFHLTNDGKSFILAEGEKPPTRLSTTKDTLERFCSFACAQTRSIQADRQRDVVGWEALCASHWRRRLCQKNFHLWAGGCPKFGRMCQLRLMSTGGSCWKPVKMHKKLPASNDEDAPRFNAVMHRDLPMLSNGGFNPTPHTRQAPSHSSVAQVIGDGHATWTHATIKIATQTWLHSDVLP